MKSKRILAQLILSAVTASAAWAQGHGGGCSCGKFLTTPIPWEIEHEPGSIYITAALEQFNHWNTISNLFNAAQGDWSAGINQRNEIFFADGAFQQSQYGMTLGPGTFGAMIAQPESAFAGAPAFNACPKPQGTTCGIFQEADVIINSDFVNGWTPYGPPDFDDDNGPAYYGATAVHELGHSFGLHHNFNNLSTMNYYEDYGVQYISTADAQALRSAYPSATRSLSDIAIYPFRYDSAQTQYDATTPISVTPTSVIAGNNLTLNQLTVENVGNVSLTDVRFEIYLSTDATITSADTRILSGQFNAGGAFAASSWWDCPSSTCGAVVAQVPASTPNGLYYVGGRVVHNGASEDAVTYNNTWVAPQRVTVSGSTGGGACVPGPTTACVLSGRFKIEVQWTDFSAVTRNAFVASAGTSDTALFYWTNPNNWELLIKGIRACTLNNKFWIYFAAATNVGYRVTVTDTVAGGAPKVYTNAVGNLAQATNDINAFNCP